MSYHEAGSVERILLLTLTLDGSELRPGPPQHEPFRH